MRSRRRFVHCLADSVCRHCKNTPLNLLLLFSAQPHRKWSNRLRNKSHVRRSEILNDEDWLCCGWLRSNGDGFFWD
ncbi:hypothetical protein V6N13_018927 [Hibiscus sabdariffa]